MIRNKGSIPGRDTLRWLRTTLITFLRSPAGKPAWFWLGGLLALMLVINAMNVGNSFVLRNLLSAIEVKNRSGFLFYVWIYLGVFIFSTITAALFRFCEERLGLLWRAWMTKRLAASYLDAKIYLDVGAKSSLTNPDQRISEDVKTLTVTTLSFVLMILNSTITVLSFSGVLWSISPLLFLIAAVYAVVGSGCIVLLGRPLNRLNYRQADYEADFRAELVRIGQSGEGIALSGYEGRLRDVLMERIERLVRNQRRIFGVNRNLSFLSSGYNYMIQLIPIAIVAPLFIDHGEDFGVIGQSSMAFATLVTALSLFVTQFQSISLYSAVLIRLGEFAETAAAAVDPADGSRIVYTTDERRFAFHDVTLGSPRDRDRALIDKLSAEFPQGLRVHIHGGDHVVRQALFRSFAGLHPLGTGAIARPPVGKVVYLPENPFLPPGSLREVLILPECELAIDDQAIAHVLSEVGLDRVLVERDGSRMDRNWRDLLSLKDEQLMAVARAVLARPTFAVLEHPSSALGLETERFVLKLFADRGITCITLGEEPPDRRVHDAALELGDQGTWQWTDFRTRAASS